MAVTKLPAVEDTGLRSLLRLGTALVYLLRTFASFLTVERAASFVTTRPPTRTYTQKFDVWLDAGELEGRIGCPVVRRGIISGTRHTKSGLNYRRKVLADR